MKLGGQATHTHECGAIPDCDIWYKSFFPNLIKFGCLGMFSLYCKKNNWGIVFWEHHL